MKHAANVFLALGLSLAAAFSQSPELRTFTNAQGRAVQARLIGVEGPNVTLELATGQKYTFAITSLSAADQQYIKSAAVPATAAAPAKYTFKPGPNDKLEPAAVNEVVGQPLFDETPLWTSSAEEVAARLKIPQESKTKTASSYRAYTKDDYQLFGAHPYSVAMYAENDK